MRNYTQRRRAESTAETRQRITDAVVRLHSTVGAAATTVTAVAAEAGVQRLTVYRHFPGGNPDLVRACGAHVQATYPIPDVMAWQRIAGAEERLTIALGDLYAYFRAGGPLLSLAARDAPEVPVLAETMAQALRPLYEAAQGIARDWPEPVRSQTLLTAAIQFAFQLTTWKSLADAAGVTDNEIVCVAVAMVRAAADCSNPAQP
ncbi:MAG: TetR family transcriptional regulator [Tepidiformaceae bacterium]